MTPTLVGTVNQWCTAVGHHMNLNRFDHCRSAIPEAGGASRGNESSNRCLASERRKKLMKHEEKTKTGMKTEMQVSPFRQNIVKQS